VAAERVHVQQLHARHRGGGQHRARYRIRNVVEFQIQEYARPERCNLLHCARPRRRKQLAADLEHTDQVRHLLGKLQGGRQRVKIERYDQAASGMGVEVHVIGDPGAGSRSVFLR
jgi:hypothetical protein